MIKILKHHSYNIKTNDILGLQDLNIQMIKTPKSLATMSRPTTDLVLGGDNLLKKRLVATQRMADHGRQLQL